MYSEDFSSGNTNETVLSRSNFPRNMSYEDLSSLYNGTSGTSAYNYLLPPQVRYSSTSGGTNLSSFTALQSFDSREFIPIKIAPELGSTLEHIGKFFKRFDAFLLDLVNDYITGKTDIPDLVREFGGIWTESSVVLLLEKLDVYRPISSTLLSKDDEANVLRELSNIRSSHLHNTYQEKSWVQREVIATQRIESIHVSPKDFTE